jgi:DNA repair exonuclease SbcCD nuclease subunit
MSTEIRFAVLSDIHLSPAGSADGSWNNVTRKSVATGLLGAAVAEIVAAGHDRVLVLGDISDDGSPEMIRAALAAIGAAGLTTWAVPGNHDAARDPRALELAAAHLPGCEVLARRPVRLSDTIALVGNELRSSDGGLSCAAASLPDVTALAAPFLVWAGHYPLVSQEANLLAAGLRYPGDLTNLGHARLAAERQDGPVLVLHGHLHTVVTAAEGRLLQLGFPALVEWPHAWTDVRLDVSQGRAAIRTQLRPVAGHWSEGTTNTLLAGPVQEWELERGRWQAIGDR